MNKIEIIIPDGLNESQEALTIAKKLMKGNKLKPSSTGQKLLGSGVSIEHLQTQIVITRKSKEPVIEMVNCSCCNQLYQNNLGVTYWHNYGGTPKARKVCSDDCREAVLQLLGSRAARSKSQLTALRFF